MSEPIEAVLRAPLHELEESARTVAQSQNISEQAELVVDETDFDSNETELVVELPELVSEQAEVIDSFRAADELPPLIFPMPVAPSATVASDAIGVADSTDEHNYDAAFEATFEETFDAAELVAETSFEETFDAADLVAETPFEATFDASYEATFDDDFNSTDDEAADATDLDDLFDDAALPTATVAAEAARAATSRLEELQDAVGVEPTNWTMRRRLAEALFEAGQRDDAIAELNIALAGFDRDAQYADAGEIADELVRVAGEVVAHHQRRLELAIRASDQNRLRDAYLDLADTLVRQGEDLRAKAVYARVLEIDPWDDRARTALGDA
ncbi:MAG: tetratricopeptide repeat protein, partial [Gemmatimonadota bacterium]|nr:tetratricopeptide repeat protein [Gemmatimonadota bacterium]